MSQCRSFNSPAKADSLVPVVVEEKKPFKRVDKNNVLKFIQNDATDDRMRH